jgi:hypothetical protein
MARRQAHVHRYKKIDIGRAKTYPVYACELSGCTSYIPVDMAVGKTTRCCVCDKPYEIKQTDLQYVRIACDVCKGKRVKNPKMRDNIMRNKEVREEAVDMMEVLLNAADIDFKEG